RCPPERATLHPSASRSVAIRPRAEARVFTTSSMACLRGARIRYARAADSTSQAAFRSSGASGRMASVPIQSFLTPTVARTEAIGYAGGWSNTQYPAESETAMDTPDELGADKARRNPAGMML